MKKDVTSHKMQVTPGVHRRRPKKETIDTLNALLAEILSELKYNLVEDSVTT